jgi:uncharacterized membrane protein
MKTPRRLQPARTSASTCHALMSGLLVLVPLAITLFLLRVIVSFRPPLSCRW